MGQNQQLSSSEIKRIYHVTYQIYTDVSPEKVGSDGKLYWLRQYKHSTLANSATEAHMSAYSRAETIFGLETMKSIVFLDIRME